MPFSEVSQLGIAELIGWAISLLGIFSTIVFGLFRLLLNQMEKRMTERDTAQDAAFSKLIERQDKDAEALRQLENSFLRFQAELPLQYVRREDYVRNQTIIEAKLDALASKLEVIQIRGKAHD